MAEIFNKISFLQLPNEIRSKILFESYDKNKHRFVLGATDLTSVSLTSNDLQKLTQPEKSSYLFEKVFNLIKATTPEEDLLKCRRVCRRWKLVLDAYSEEQGYTGRNKRYNPYDVLGINYGSSIATVKKAAAQKLKVHHPDKGGSNSKCVQVIKAKEILTNPEYKQCFKNSHKSPFHLKLAWNSYELKATRQNILGQQQADFEDSDSE